MMRKWMLSLNVTENQEVRKLDVISVQEMENENSDKNDKYIDDDKLRDIIKTITLEMTTDLKSELKALAERVGKIDSSLNALKKLYNK